MAVWTNALNPLAKRLLRMNLKTGAELVEKPIKSILKRMLSLVKPTLDDAYKRWKLDFKTRKDDALFSVLKRYDRTLGNVFHSTNLTVSEAVFSD